MRTVVVVIVVAVACCSGFSNSLADPPQTQPASQPVAGGLLTPSAEMGKRTQAYWDQCSEVNKQFVTDKGELWFKNFRPAAVGATCRDAAKRLREIDNKGVDPEVIDHVNRVIRGFEQMGAIAETKGRQSQWQDTGAIIALVILEKIRASKGVGAVADGGRMPIGLGILAGREATREGEAEVISIANKLIDSEERVIKHVRKTYGIELRPW